MKSSNKKQISILLVLAVSFLIEYPLRTRVISLLSFSQPLAYFVTSIVFYAALFACFMIVSKGNTASKSVLKSICLVLGFFVFEQIVSMFLFGEIIALAYVIIRPLIIFVVILLGNQWLFKNKLALNKWVYAVLVCAFVLGALFNVLDYVRIINQSVANDFFSYVTLLTLSNSVYTVLAKLCTYIFTFALFMKKENV